MQTQAKFCVCFTKINAKPFLWWTKAGHLPTTKKLFLRLLSWDDELLSTLKITTFSAKSLPKFYEPVPSNAIPQPLIHALFSLLLFFTILVASNKQLLNLKFLGRVFGHMTKS